jgi:hypothetical protein
VSENLIHVGFDSSFISESSLNFKYQTKIVCFSAFHSLAVTDLAANVPKAESLLKGGGALSQSLLIDPTIRNQRRITAIKTIIPLSFSVDSVVRPVNVVRDFKILEISKSIEPAEVDIAHTFTWGFP